MARSGAWIEGAFGIANSRSCSNRIQLTRVLTCYEVPPNRIRTHSYRILNRPRLTPSMGPLLPRRMTDHLPQPITTHA